MPRLAVSAAALLALAACQSGPEIPSADYAVLAEIEEAASAMDAASQDPDSHFVSPFPTVKLVVDETTGDGRYQLAQYLSSKQWIPIARSEDGDKTTWEFMRLSMGIGDQFPVDMDHLPHLPDLQDFSIPPLPDLSAPSPQDLVLPPQPEQPATP